ncbi:hypothetical protein [Campylobacter corcagiensis]|uniref:Type 4a pilus biogenesis protein PilO n=1 Tax=Campylobacter corcagiensis TaxID=1448857 RepID=A0A7M1LF59_9BACT|nr:hypothetical protein [Campylobacter corcagiensis]QKF64605.1 hypothetical protein CCORG_0747 [Campylobacter corcagiensis]QOQ87222.1 hypothetical protein IMC76_08440 [Campylobacter corcagiensis]
MRKQGILDKLDAYLIERGASGAQVVKIGAALFVALIVYLGVFPYAESYFNENETRLNTAVKNLNEANNYLRTKNDSTIATFQNDLANEQRKLDDAIAENDYIDSKLKEISVLTYNEQNWADFLDSLTTFAKEHDVKIYKITSDVVKDVVLQKVQPMLNISIVGEGNFHSMLKYINSIEESKMVVDVNGLEMNATTKDGKSIGSNIKISVWGMKYR